MQDSLPKLHTKTYDSVANEYEKRVEILRPVTEYCMSNFVKELRPGAKVLDIGCAVGYTVEILRKSGMVADGIDISPKMIEFAQKRNPESKLIVGDFMNTKFPRNYYDGILAFAFIHLFPKDTVVQHMNKIIKILKPKGIIYITTTKSQKTSEGFEEKEGYQAGSKRFRKRWTQDEFEDFLVSCQLQIIWHEDIKDEFDKLWMNYMVKKL